MSRILITADIHFGLSGKLDDILWSMRTMREYAHNEKIDTICVLGDLFHDRESLNIEALSKSYQFFEEAKNKYNQEWIIFPGNHDMYLRNSWEINALQSLEKVATIIEDIKMIKIYGRRFWIVPFVHYESVYMKIMKAIEGKHQRGDVLLTHIGVNNATLNECYLLKHWSIVDFEESKFERVFAGHFHCHQNVGRGNVWYPGSPIPFRFDEGMVPHGFIEYNVDSREVKFIDIFDLSLVDGRRPPDYITLTDDMLSDETITFENDHVRLQLEQDYTSDGLARLGQKVRDSGAASVKFVKQKEQQIDLSKQQSDSEFSLETPDLLFDKWLEHDKPKKLDLDLLRKLNKEVIGDNSG